MTEQQFDERLRRIEEQYALKREGADAYRDQEVARLFVECGWTQERIGMRMGWTKGRVSQRLLLGRFLKFTSGKHSELPGKPLTERRFRDAWSAARKSGHRKDTEADCFARVVDRLKADTSETPRKYGNLVKKPGIKAAVVEVLSDGKRRTSAEIALMVSEKIPDTDVRQVSEAILALQKKPPEGMAVDHRAAGRTHKYRLVERRKGTVQHIPVDPDAAGAVAAEALPLIEECIEIMKHPVVGRQETLALDHLWKVERMLKRLLVPEEVV